MRKPNDWRWLNWYDNRKRLAWQLSQHQGEPTKAQNREMDRSIRALSWRRVI